MSEKPDALPGPARDFLQPSGVLLKTQLRQVERRNRILKLTRAGATPYQIEEVFRRGDPANGVAPEAITAQQIQKVIRKHLDGLHLEDARTVEHLRALENERLDELQTKLWAKATANPPDYKAIDRLMKISERRARLNGLDHAVKVQHDLGPEVLREMGVDPESVARGEEAFKTAFSDIDIPDVDVIEVSQDEFEDAVAQLGPGSG